MRGRGDSGGIRRVIRANRLKEEVATFNASNPIGTEVRYYPGPGPRGGQARVTNTTAEAMVLGGTQQVVWLRDVSGCVNLDHVEPSDRLEVNGEAEQPEPIGEDEHCFWCEQVMHECECDERCFWCGEVHPECECDEYCDSTE